MADIASIHARIEGPKESLNSINFDKYPNADVARHRDHITLDIETTDINGTLNFFAQIEKEHGVKVLFVVEELNGLFFYTNYLQDHYYVDFYTTNPNFEYSARVPASQIADTITFLTQGAISTPDEVDDWNEEISDTKDTHLSVYQYELEEKALEW